MEDPCLPKSVAPAPLYPTGVCFPKVAAQTPFADSVKRGNGTDVTSADCQGHSKHNPRGIPDDAGNFDAVEAEVEHFLQQHRIDSKTSQALRGLRPALQRQVMASDPSSCRQPSAWVWVKIRDVMGVSRRPLGTPRRWTGKRSDYQEKSDQAEATAMANCNESNCGGSAGQLLQGAVETFLHRNDVDRRAAAALRELPPHLQLEVIKVGDVTGCRNPSAALMATINRARNFAAPCSSMSPEQRCVRRKTVSIIDEVTGLSSPSSHHSPMLLEGHDRQAIGGALHSTKITRNNGRQEQESGSKFSAQILHTDVQEYLYRHGISPHDPAAEELAKLPPMLQQQVVSCDLVDARKPGAVLRSRIQRVKSGQPVFWTHTSNGPNLVDVDMGASQIMNSSSALSSQHPAIQQPCVPIASSAENSEKHDGKGWDVEVEEFLKCNGINAALCKTMRDLLPKQQRDVMRVCTNLATHQDPSGLLLAHIRKTQMLSGESLPLSAQDGATNANAPEQGNSAPCGGNIAIESNTADATLEQSRSCGKRGLEIDVFFQHNDIPVDCEPARNLLAALPQCTFEKVLASDFSGCRHRPAAVLLSRIRRVCEEAEPGFCVGEQLDATTASMPQQPRDPPPKHIVLGVCAPPPPVRKPGQAKQHDPAVGDVVEASSKRACTLSNLPVEGKDMQTLNLQSQSVGGPCDGSPSTLSLVSGLQSKARPGTLPISSPQDGRVDTDGTQNVALPRGPVNLEQQQSWKELSDSPRAIASTDAPESLEFAVEGWLRCHCIDTKSCNAVRNLSPELQKKILELDPSTCRNPSAFVWCQLRRMTEGDACKEQKKGGGGDDTADSSGVHLFAHDDQEQHTRKRCKPRQPPRPPPAPLRAAFTNHRPGHSTESFRKMEGAGLDGEIIDVASTLLDHKKKSKVTAASYGTSQAVIASDGYQHLPSERIVFSLVLCRGTADLPTSIPIRADSRPLVIGRAASCDVVLRLTHVSKAHAQVHVQEDPEGKWVLILQDTSSNGTWLNEQKVSPKHLVPMYAGDKVSFLPPNVNKAAPDLEPPIYELVEGALPGALPLTTTSSDGGSLQSAPEPSNNIIHLVHRGDADDEHCSSGDLVLPRPKDFDAATPQTQLIPAMAAAYRDFAPSTALAAHAQQDRKHNGIQEWLVSLGEDLLEYEDVLLSSYDDLQQIRDLYAENVLAFFEDNSIHEPKHRWAFREALHALKSAPL